MRILQGQISADTTDVIVLGNGPSLRGFDFDRLIGKTVFAVNRINLAFPSTKWRPSVYSCVDRSDNPMVREDLRLHAEQGYPVFVVNYMLDWANQGSWRDTNRNWDWVKEKNLVISQRCYHYAGLQRETDGWHFPHLCSYGGSTWFSVQLAIQGYGARRIRLLGVDGVYEAGKENHFIDGYVPADTYEFPEVARDKSTEQANARRIAFLECEKIGVDIRDLSPEDV